MYPQRKSPRLQGYDYTQSGAYFVTLCTHQRQNLFGHITETMILNSAGFIAQRCWMTIPAHFPHVKLDVFVVMPNHVHGILVFNTGGTRHCRVPTHESFGKPVRGFLSTVMRSYKAPVTRNIHHMTPEKVIWQGRFYDHVIRNEEELNHIRE